MDSDAHGAITKVVDPNNYGDVASRENEDPEGELVQCVWNASAGANIATSGPTPEVIKAVDDDLAAAGY